MTREKRLAAVLAACNRIRVKHGWKPVQRLRKGRRYDTCGCPVARTIGHGCWMTQHCGYSFDPYASKDPKFTRNALLQDFARQFDGRVYPELVKR